ncbi:MAG: radical SAM/SPASM domain-containing protein [Thermodesulfobacteriota bacterium]
MKQRFGKIKTVYSYYTNNHAVGAYPMQVGIELTNNCNLRCKMCPHPRMARQKGFITKGIFKKIIDEIKGKSEFVYLYGMGESLIHPEFFELADYVKNSGLKTSVSTNITLLTEEKSQKLLESGIDFIVLALDGVNKETYEKIRIGGKFEENLKRIKYFLQLKNKLKAKCHVDVQFILMNDNKEEAESTSKLFSKAERSSINSNRLKPVYVSPSINTENIVHKHPCFFLWSTMTITWDGRVSMCCMDYDVEVELGNVCESSVFEVWNNSKIATLRNLHKRLEYRKMPMCNKCFIPEKNYFSTITILSSAFLKAGTMRRLLPIFEKTFLLNKFR